MGRRKALYHEVKEKVLEVDRLRKERGWGIAKACRAVGIGTATYYRFKSNPESFPRGEAKEEPRRDVRDVDENLRRYGIVTDEHPLVAKVREVKQELARTEEALKQAYSMMGTPAGQGGSPAQVQDPVAVLKILASGVRSMEQFREDMKQLLEKLGLKVEDRYIPREEVERLLEEERRKAVEEAMDDRRIQAVENIINRAVDRVTDLFKPLIDVWVQNLLTGRMQSPTREEQPSQDSEPQAVEARGKRECEEAELAEESPSYVARFQKGYRLAEAKRLLV